MFSYYKDGQAVSSEHGRTKPIGCRQVRQFVGKLCFKLYKKGKNTKNGGGGVIPLNHKKETRNS